MSNIIHLSLSDDSQAQLTRIMRQARMTSLTAAEDHSFPLMVVEEQNLDEALAALNDPVRAVITGFGILPQEDETFLYMDLEGEVLDVAREAGLDAVKMLIGVCSCSTDELQEFVGEPLEFDSLRVTSPDKEPYDKSLNQEVIDDD